MELRSVNGHDVASGNGSINGVKKPSHTTEMEFISAEQRDVQALARLGKKPVLKVRNERSHTIR